jgi:AraC family transcriptional regulator, ethanolamine operon transcriptional activator
MSAQTANAMSLGAQYLGLGGRGASVLGSSTFTDVEEQAGALTGWNQDYLQLSAGAFQGEICQIEGSGIKLFIERVQQSLLQTGVLPSNVLAVGIPLSASGAGMFCGQPCSSDAFHVFSGASGFEFRTSQQHTMLGIELQLGEGWLAKTGQDFRSGSRRDLPTRAGALPLSRAALAELKTYLLALLQSAQMSPELLSTPAVVATVADFLLDRMAQQSIHGTQPDEPPAHQKLVQRACGLVHDNLEQAPTVAQLCVDLGVSRRTLQNGFQRALSVSPLNYLKAVRLGQARRALKQVDSVTEAATAFGFWHFGHFSQDYQTMFGELPSDTLRRHQHD